MKPYCLVPSHNCRSSTSCKLIILIIRKSSDKFFKKINGKRCLLNQYPVPPSQACRLAERKHFSFHFLLPKLYKCLPIHCTLLPSMQSRHFRMSLRSPFTLFLSDPFFSNPQTSTTLNGNRKGAFLANTLYYILAERKHPPLTSP